ncbi:potassium transporter Kup [Luteipulveratus mongoliensis]|uniref:potassium transporter Kup n=1 Tax=Luteipulveratus mongoliensis TaxID=571913 RepID=UPI000AE1625B|nr:potassium transporter Kup [Luteipulveratus mongoliensis]
MTSSRQIAHRSPAGVLFLGALGVVFGDIGTSPLYAMQTVFSIDHNKVQLTESDVYGVVSLIFWAITLIVTIKYVGLILRADNDGEGGILALAALARRSLPRGDRRVPLVMVLGVIGASLFFGDSLITPAISVLSAMEGLEVAAPSVEGVILPVAVVIIVALFVVQRFGTQVIGRAFGPVMVVWFLTLGVLGIRPVIDRPGILAGLSPTYALAFVLDRPFVAFIAMGAVVLAITGAEALYADMGHFGRAPIRRAWFFMVFPCLTLNYLGQAALILNDPKTVSSPFFELAPGWAQLPLVVLAAAATVIASQAVISGAYSVSRQAERLGFLPRQTVIHTSNEGGQIYVPAINWILFVGVLLLMFAFRSSAKLATAYGLAVTATFILTTTLFLIYAQAAWKWPRWRIVLVAVLFGVPELTFFSANLTKVVHGGWLPALIAALVATVMFTWRQGGRIVSARRAEKEGPLMPFIDKVNAGGLTKVPGTAVFLHPNAATTPLALRQNVSFNHVIHEKSFIVTTVSDNVPHVPLEERVTFDDLGDASDSIDHVRLRFGFQDDQDVPAALRQAQAQGLPIDPDEAYYFLSRIRVEPSRTPAISRWRARIFVGLAHNAANPAQYFGLPESRTIVMGAHIEI